MSILDSLFKQDPASIEAQAAKPLIEAKAQAAKEEGKATTKRAIADANATIVSNITDNYLKVIEVTGDTNAMSSFDDYLQGMERFAETIAKVTKAVSA